MSFTLAQADIIIGVTGADKLNSELNKTQGQLGKTAKGTKGLSDAQKIAAEITNRNLTAQDKYNRKLEALKSLKPQLETSIYRRELENLHNELQEGQAWETHVRNVRRAKEEMDTGAIGQKQFARRVNDSNMELRKAQAHLGVFAGGSKSAAFASGKLGFALQQASFGAQDFVQVYGQTGLSGALRASMNNWAQVLAIIGPMTGAIGGLGLTIAGIAWANYADGAKKSAELTKEFKDEVEALKDSLENVADLASFGFDVRTEEGRTAKSTRSSIRSLESENVGAKAKEEAIRKLDAEFARRIVAIERDAKHFTREGEGLTEEEKKKIEKLQEERDELAKNIDAIRIENQVRRRKIHTLKAILPALEEEEKKAKEEKESKKEKEKKDKEADKQKREDDKVANESAALRLRFDRIDQAAVEKNQKERDDIFKKSHKDELAAIARKGPLGKARAIFERNKDRAFEIEDAMMRGIISPEEMEHQMEFLRKLSASDIRGLKKDVVGDKEAKSSFVGIEALSKQIQMALNPTAQEKREMEKIKLAKQNNDKLERIAKSVENFGAFVSEG